MGSLDVFFDGSKHGDIEVLLLGGSLVSVDVKDLDSYEVIKLGLSYGKLLGTILGNADGVTLGIDVGRYIFSLDGSFDGSNDDKLEGL